MLYVVSCMLYVVCCMLYAVRCKIWRKKALTLWYLVGENQIYKNKLQCYVSCSLAAKTNISTD